MNEKPIHVFVFPLIPKTCSICGGINPACAKYCGDCGSGFIESPDLLQSKKNRDDDPKSYRTCQNKS
jgi:hypothetical protein